MSETRTKESSHTVDFLDRIGSAEVLADPATRKDFLLGLDYPSFKDWLIRLNGLARGKAPHERGIDGEQVYIMTMLPPEPEDKEELLVATLDAVHRVLENPGEDEDNLRTASLILSGAINFIHPFIDGNGRTSRAAGLLIRDGFDRTPESKERLNRVLGDEGSTAFHNNPGMLDGYITGPVVRSRAPAGADKWPLRAMPDAPIGEAFDQGDKFLGRLTNDSKAKIVKVMLDPAFADYAAAKVMMERNLLPDGADFGDKNFVSVEPDKYFAKFNDSDVDALMDESRAMRRDRVLRFIQAMEDPGSLNIKLDERTAEGFGLTDPLMTLKDYYEANLQKYSKLYNGDSGTSAEDIPRESAA